MDSWNNYDNGLLYIKYIVISFLVGISLIGNKATHAGHSVSTYNTACSTKSTLPKLGSDPGTVFTPVSIGDLVYEQNFDGGEPLYSSIEYFMLDNYPCALNRHHLNNPNAPEYHLAIWNGDWVSSTVDVRGFSTTPELLDTTPGGKFLFHYTKVNDLVDEDFYRQAANRLGEAYGTNGHINIPAVIGYEYQLRYQVADWNNNPPNFNNFISDEFIGSSSVTPAGRAWELQSFNWKNRTQTNAVISMRETNANGAGKDYALDDVQLVWIGVFPVLSLTKTHALTNDADSNGVISPGDEVTYTFTAQNIGQADATNVQIVDPLPNLSALSCSSPMPATLTPTSSLTCTATYTVTQADATNGSVNNTATVSYDNEPDVTADDTYSVFAPVLTFNKTFSLTNDADASGNVTEGDILTYSFAVTNDGNAPANNVSISDPLTGLSALSCTPSQPVTLAPTESLNCSATYTVTNADAINGSVDNTATVSADGLTDVTDSVSVPVVIPAPILSISKTSSLMTDNDGNGVVTTGDVLEFTITVTNSGLEDATGVTVSDPLPGLSALSCSPAQPATLAPSSVMTCTGTYTVTSADATNGTVDNTASVSSVELPSIDAVLATPVACNGFMTASFPQSVLNFSSPSATPSCTSFAFGGDAESVQFTVTDLDEETGGNPNNRYEDRVEVNYGATTEQYLGGTVSMAGIDIAGPITSVEVCLDNVTASSDSLSVSLSTITYCAATQNADIVVTKTDGETNYTPGENFSFTITVQNNGPQAADGTRVVDTLPSWAENVTWSCSASGGAVCPNLNGSGNIDELIATLPNGGSLTYTLQGNYSQDQSNY